MVFDEFPQKNIVVNLGAFSKSSTCAIKILLLLLHKELDVNKKHSKYYELQKQKSKKLKM